MGSADWRIGWDRYSESKPWESPLWQVVTKDPSRRRLVKRERAEVADRRRKQQQQHAKARKQRQELEVARRAAEQALLGDDAAPPEGTPLAFPLKEVRGTHSVSAGPQLPIAWLAKVNS